MTTNLESVPFGKKFRDKYFNFNELVVNLNHGSYGAVPSHVLESKVNHIKNVLQFPDQFYRNDHANKVTQVQKQVADLVDADPENLVFVTNDTTGINAILRSCTFKKGDKVIYFSTIYETCFSALKYLRDTIGIELIEIKLNYPMSNQQILDTFTQTIDNNNNGEKIKMALFDTISSVPAALLPWGQLCKICRENGILSVVDGAHGIGIIPISLRKARPDFFTSNLHKWLFTPVSLALLYVDQAHHSYIQPLVVSSLYESRSSSPLSTKFYTSGTFDYSNILAASDAIEFRQEICGGEEAIREYCHRLAKSASELVSEQFGTEIFHGNGDNIITSMFNVRLPYDGIASPGIVISKYTEYICNKWHTFVPIFRYNGRWWCRFSAQIYLDIEDFKYGIRAVLDSLEYLKREFESEVIPDRVVLSS